MDTKLKNRNNGKIVSNIDGVDKGKFIFSVDLSTGKDNTVLTNIKFNKSGTYEIKDVQINKESGD